MAITGRPSKLTDKLQTRICNMLRVGESVSAICRAVQIERSTFHRWLDPKLYPGRKYCEFRESVRQARASRRR